MGGAVRKTSEQFCEQSRSGSSLESARVRYPRGPVVAPSTRSVLQTLSRARLAELGRVYSVAVPEAATREQQAEALAASARVHFRDLRPGDIAEVRHHLLGDVADLGPPRHFAAHLHALKWSRVTATSATLFQSPFRAGIDLLAHQLTPLRKALLLPRERGFAVIPWSTPSRFIVSHALLRRPKYRDPLLAHVGDRAAKSLLILDEAHVAAPVSLTH